MCDIIYIEYDVINIMGVILNIEGCDVIKGICDAMHTEYDVIDIVCVMSSGQWLWYN